MFLKSNRLDITDWTRMHYEFGAVEMYAFRSQSASEMTGHYAWFAQGLVGNNVVFGPCEDDRELRSRIEAIAHVHDSDLWNTGAPSGPMFYPGMMSDLILKAPTDKDGKVLIWARFHLNGARVYGRVDPRRSDDHWLLVNLADQYDAPGALEKEKRDRPPSDEISLHTMIDLVGSARTLCVPIDATRLIYPQERE
jgi:hypothetical protein